eukprot:gnl/TRDRNA2_/TRDRNA2_88111_c0_seq1.p1 gnl/TRDRNA2_/TRDRNA2_88111_c0~~gnl/TRDRNA2_/TRDRNA2_88111_c0_seq1.p1  ORF type:complete len:264 (+),score=31.14 gnl/TRDRNA2_/TRDRNA2_88111_c0_seq1:98-793(+)
MGATQKPEAIPETDMIVDYQGHMRSMPRLALSEEEADPSVATIFDDTKDPRYLPTQGCGGHKSSRHPYVYQTREIAKAACELRDCERLCTKKEIEGHSRCAMGWLSDGKGWWMNQQRKHCGRKGFNGGWSGKAGSYCCGCDKYCRHIAACAEKNTQWLKIGSSSGNEKCITNPFPSKLKCEEFAGNEPYRWPIKKHEKFSIFSKPSKICARRTDSHTGWTINLQIECCKLQ